MPTNIIQISDTHFGNPDPTFYWEDIKKTLIKQIDSMDGKKIIILSGDITFKGMKRGYKEAEIFFKEIIKSCGIDKANVLACPGNHDITLEKEPFGPFDNFIYSLRQDNKISFSKKTSIPIGIGNTFYVLINSAHHLNHTFGLIPDDAFTILQDGDINSEEWQKKIIVTHHHLIGQVVSDTSTTRNALPLLHQADKAEFDYILHGHQHSKSDLSVGSNKVRILSARSMSYPGVGYYNGFTRLELESGVVKPYVLTLDEYPGSLTAGVIK